MKATSIDDPDGENVLTKNQFTVDKDGYCASCVESLLTVFVLESHTPFHFIQMLLNQEFIMCN